MGKRGPKRIQINWEEFDKLASYQCTQEEIAAFFDTSVDSLERACEEQRGMKLADLWDKRKCLGRVKLRKIQYAIAEKGGNGSAAMAIYLDKKVFPHERVYDIPPPVLPLSDTPSPKQAETRSFEEFCEVARHPKPYPKQVEMQSFAICSDEPRLILGARGYGKTDYVTVDGNAYDIYCNYMQGLHKDKETCSTNLIITKSRSRNAALIAEIAEALIANGVPLEMQNSTRIRVLGMQGKDHSAEAITIKSSFRGRHPKRITMDDPVTEEDTSEAMRVLVKKKYDEAYKLCKNIVVIGQPASPFDLFAELRPLIKKMELPHGSIPELDADLDAMALAGVDAHSILMSYHLKIPAEGTAIFAGVKFLEKFPNGDSVAFIDPSDGGDYTAISVLKGYMDGIAVVGHAYKKAWYHCLDDIVAIFRARGVRKVCFETNCTGSQPVEQLRTLLAPYGIGVVGKHSDSNKHACIVSAGSYSHLIHLSKESDRVYTDQVVKYEYKSKFDDSPDSLARGLEWIGLIRGKK